jgi:putative N-acetylmannosamine-6-phosphate epimerase
MADRRTYDVTRLSFPLQLVLFVAATVVSVYATNSATQSQLKSDVRDIVTRLELGRDVQKAQSQALDERFNALKASIDTTATTMKGSIDAITRRQEMQQIQIGELKAAIEKLSQGRK